MIRPANPISQQAQQALVLSSLHKPRIWSEWRALLDFAQSELELQEFLEQHPALLPGALGAPGTRAHHRPQYGAVFRQAPLKGLAPKLVPDFMWITSETGLLRPILIEIEAPRKRWMTADFTTTSAKLTQAHNQLARWQSWFSDPDNQADFKRMYIRSQLRHLPMRPHDILVYGRSSEIDAARAQAPLSQWDPRQSLRRSSETLLTYDSLQYTDALENFVCSSISDSGKKEVAAVPPTFIESQDVFGPLALGELYDETKNRSARSAQARWPEIADAWARQRERALKLDSDGILTSLKY